MATKTKRNRKNRSSRRRSNAAVVLAPRRKAARRNGLFSGHRKSGGRRRRRNPSVGGEVTGTVIQAGWTILGAVGSRVVSQFILGANNAGMMGYATNGAVTLGLYFVAKSFLRNREAAQAILLGGTVGLVLRLLSDYTPFGQWVTQNFSGLGDYQATTFFVPLAPNNQQSTTDASMQLPSSITDQITQAKQALMASANAAAGKRVGSGSARSVPAVAAASGMGAVGGGRYSTKGRYS